MESMNVWLSVLAGGIGGLIPDLLKALRLRFAGRPAYMGTLWYWLMLVLLAAVGAVVAAMSAPNDLWEAVAYGIAAPTFLTKLVGSDKQDDLSDASHVSAWERMRRWWA